MKNKHAVRLARLGKGKKKNMSDAALEQRRNALIKANAAKSSITTKYTQTENTSCENASAMVK